MVERLSATGLCLRRDKCVFMESEVVYLGYRINHKGIHPVADKVKAIASVLEPLHELLRKLVPWRWGSKTVPAV